MFFFSFFVFYLYEFFDGIVCFFCVCRLVSSIFPCCKSSSHKQLGFKYLDISMSCLMVIQIIILIKKNLALEFFAAIVIDATETVTMPTSTLIKIELSSLQIPKNKLFDWCDWSEMGSWSNWVSCQNLLWNGINNWHTRVIQSSTQRALRKTKNNKLSN